MCVKLIRELIEKHELRRKLVDVVQHLIIGVIFLQLLNVIYLIMLSFGKLLQHCMIYVAY